MSHGWTQQAAQLCRGAGKTTSDSSGGGRSYPDCLENALASPRLTLTLMKEGAEKENFGLGLMFLKGINAPWRTEDIFVQMWRVTKGLVQIWHGLIWHSSVLNVVSPRQMDQKGTATRCRMVKVAWVKDSREGSGTLKTVSIIDKAHGGGKYS